MESEKYLPELMAEKDSLDPSFVHAARLVSAGDNNSAALARRKMHPKLPSSAGRLLTSALGALPSTDSTQREITKMEGGEEIDEEKFVDVVSNKNMKLSQKVLIPVKQFPKFNFVGKLLGPRGNSLKRLQEETLTKMSILGKGSMRDKAKEEELRKGGETKYTHLNEDLHVLIEVFAPPSEAYARMGHALEEVKKFLIPDYNDEIRQQQLQELSYLNGAPETPETPAVRGKPVRGRGALTPALTRGRGGVPPPTAAVPRGGPAPRGALAGRGLVVRGRGAPAPRARGAPGYRPPPPPAQDTTYGEYAYGDGYGATYEEHGYDTYENNYREQHFADHNFVKKNKPHQLAIQGTF
uniref:K Homology domain-containing protein n=1 Tax=Callorhinchus milii TaxID=7868 RepID=A0A4W3JDP9_CALMI